MNHVSHVDKISANNIEIEVHKHAEGKDEIHRRSRDAWKIRSVVQNLDNVTLGKIPAEFGEQLGRAGRRRVLEAYTWRSTAQRTADWYAEVLERREASTGRPC